MNLNDCILVTGSGGVLGQAILGQLTNEGFDNVLSPSSSELNLLDSEKLEVFFEEKKPKFVFHLASLVFGLKGNLNNQINSISKNTIINNNLLMACFRHGVKKVFFAGTVAAYPYPFIELPLREDFYLSGEPHSGEYGYAASKRHGLSYLNIMKNNHEVDYCYGIFTNLYGPHDKFDIENGHVIPSLIEKSFISISSGENSLEVWGNKNTTRDFMLSTDAARAAVLAMKKYSGLINIASGVETSIENVCNAINKWHGYKLTLAWDQNAPIGVPNRSVDNSRLQGLGFKCDYDIEDGIKLVMDWYCNNTNMIRR
ncbi:NAD-dependent epimerase/dehydratase family protein [Plesiomonas shigelloides]|uniref:NAD-dependent epimerase/dehydratase family protein n=1 Tax=Plesiomonas shigelloides TaxID=703 RepID=UPI00057A3959|nr:NAD-dependent epimerase/dehydratase family protein [Plesiomonas shigelloides]